MSHYIVVRIAHGLYFWRCTCGSQGKRGYGYPGLPQLYGRAHVKAKHGS